MKNQQTLNKYKRDAITAARELYYPQQVINKIRIAETESEVSRIMRDARLKKYS